MTAATPLTGSSFFFRSSSAKRRSATSCRCAASASSAGTLADSARRMIGSVDGSKRSSTGALASSGSCSASSLSRTSSPAWSMLVPQANCSTTSLCPVRETEVSRRRFLTTPTDSSTGSDSSVSISAGAAPVYSVRTVSVG